MKKLSFILVFASMLVTAVLASWGTPSKYRERLIDKNRKILRNCRDEKEIQILNSSDNTLIWKTPIHGYHQIFSQFESNGSHIVHLIGNHKVESPNHICLVVYQKNNEPIVYHAVDFLEMLVPVENPGSIFPKQMWFNKSLYFKQDMFALELANGKNATIWLNEKKVLKGYPF